MRIKALLSTTLVVSLALSPIALGQSKLPLSQGRHAIWRYVQPAGTVSHCHRSMADRVTCSVVTPAGAANPGWIFSGHATAELRNGKLRCAFSYPNGSTATYWSPCRPN